MGLALLLTGCLATLVPTDFDEIYDPAAADRHPDRNPVIVIPGFLGTRLVDAETETVVWGAVGGAYADPSTPEGARLIALSMRPEVPSPAVEPGGVLDAFQIRGLSIQLRPYLSTLRALGAAGYRDEDLTRRDVSFDGQHLNSFQFDYDWRRSNAENAQRLHQFILDKAAYCRADRERRGLDAKAEIRFDFITHSMGGLLARYYLRYGPQPLPGDGSLPELTWEGARYVERAILVAPPNAGAAKALLNLTRGVRHAPGFPFYHAMLNGTFPSAYELLPRARHGAYVEAVDPAKRVDSFLDPNLWEKAGWGLAARDREQLLEWLLPDVDDPTERRQLALAHQRRMLRRADQFQRALDLPAAPPPGTELFLIAGDSVPTASVLAIDAATGEVEVFQKASGDGSVLRTSALMDERLGRALPAKLTSPISWRQTVFVERKHSRMSIDPAFADRVVYWLLEAPRPFPT